MSHTQTYHETRTPVDTQTIPLTPTSMISIATQTTDLSHETSISEEAQTIQIWGIEEVCQICVDSSDESDARISRRTTRRNRFLGTRGIG